MLGSAFSVQWFGQLNEHQTQTHTDRLTDGTSWLHSGDSYTNWGLSTSLLRWYKDV